MGEVNRRSFFSEVFGRGANTLDETLEAFGEGLTGVAKEKKEKPNPGERKTAYARLVDGVKSILDRSIGPYAEGAAVTGASYGPELDGILQNPVDGMPQNPSRAAFLTSLLSGGKWVALRKFLSPGEARAEGTTDIETLIDEANGYIKNGNPDKAISTLEGSYQKITKERTGGWTGRSGEIFDDLKKTLAFAYVEEGRKAVRSKQYGEAEKLVQKALDTYENFSLAYNLMGLINFNQKRNKNALRYNLLALKNIKNSNGYPDNAIILRYLGSDYVHFANFEKKNGNVKNMIRFYEKAADIYTQSLDPSLDNRDVERCKRVVRRIKKKYLNNPTFK